MSSVFHEQILADKLSKLNSTQQCIETLSHWCIFHRKKAEQVVQTWDKQFHSSQKEQKIPFLYLANDILQNSKRNGNEFVGEFWKVLPAALKDVVENGDEHGKNVVSRLVGIWEERRVFGSRTQGLKDLMLGNEQPPLLELNNRKRSRSVRIVKRDSRSIKIKLSIGGMPEKIVSAFHSVISEHPSEEDELSKCNAAVRRVGKMEKDVNIACSREGDSRRATLANELVEEELILKQCIDKIKSVEANRAALVAQMKEALNEQESELESVRTQLQVAQAQLEEAANMRRRLNNEPITVTQTNGPGTESTKKSAAAIAAEVADKLTASTHSQQIMTSVLSSFAAEAAKSSGAAATTNQSSSFSEAQPEKAKLEKPMTVPSTTAFVPVPHQHQHQHQTVLVQPTHLHNQTSNPQPHYNVYPAPTQQYLQPSGSLMIGLPYTYSTMPQQPPPPSQQMMNVARPAPFVQQQPVALIQQPQPPPPTMALHQPMPLNQQSAPLALQQPAPPSYRPLQPPGMAFYHPQTQ